MYLKVVEWNVAGHKGRYGKECTEDYYDFIIEQNISSDVLILTEYKESKNEDKEFEKRLNKEYHFKKKNDVLIALNKATWDKIEECDCGILSPNICIAKGTLKKTTKEIMIVGIRICIPGKTLNSIQEKKEDYINRYEQLIQLKKMLKKIEFTTPVILAGDFNNSRYFGEMNDLKLKDGDMYNGLLTQHYNLQMIKAFFYDLGFEYHKSTPFGNVETVYSFKNRFTYKLDHIFVKNIKVESVFYSEEKHESDHRMLLSDVYVKI